MRLALLLVYILCAASYGYAAQWGTDSFTISWADGYRRVSPGSGTKIQLLSDDGTGVTMTVISHRYVKEEEITKMRHSFISYAEEELPKIAKRHGEITIPLARESLPSGAILFSLGEHDKGKKKFGLFFLYISPQGRVAQIVVEGPGQPEEKIAMFRTLVETARWKEEPNQSP